MKIKLITIGKTDEKYLQIGIEKYCNRLKHYVSFKLIELNDVKVGKKNNIELQKEKEADEILMNINKNDFIILLDENGTNYNSIEFSEYLQKRMNSGLDIVFIIGGPFGFSKRIYEVSNSKIALSKMTFSHQMVRLFFTEQLYRGLTILKGEKYHHK